VYKIKIKIEKKRPNSSGYEDEVIIGFPGLSNFTIMKGTFMLKIEKKAFFKKISLFCTLNLEKKKKRKSTSYKPEEFKKSQNFIFFHIVWAELPKNHIFDFVPKYLLRLR